MDVEYPTRCRIVDVIGEIGYGLKLITPEGSKLHVGKEGWACLAQVTDHDWRGVRIKLDDGTVLQDHECWWEPIPNPANAAAPPAKKGGEQHN